jgi:hypothetical protein
MCFDTSSQIFRWKSELPFSWFKNKYPATTNQEAYPVVLSILWVVAPCSHIKVRRRLGIKLYLFQIRRVSRTRKRKPEQRLLPFFWDARPYMPVQVYRRCGKSAFVFNIAMCSMVKHWRPCWGYWKRSLLGSKAFARGSLWDSSTFLPQVQIASGSHPVSSPEDIGEYFHSVKSAEASFWPLTSALCGKLESLELYLHFPMHIQGTLLI